MSTAVNTTSPTAALDAIPDAQTGLRARIGWMCHPIRIAAVLWAGWNLVNVVRGWYSLDRAKVIAGLNDALKADLSEISNTQVVAVFATAVTVWTLEAAIVYCVWRLTAGYLQGRIFTIDAAIWMRRLGVTGLVAVLAVVVWRRAALFIYTIHGHLPAVTLLLFGQLVMPGDLLRLVFCLFVIALAHIFKAAAELADDHAGIV
jgi:hypothetical protein